MQHTDTAVTLRPVPTFVLNRTRLDQLRKANDIPTEEALAKVIDVHSTTLMRVSKGEVKPSNEFMAKVATAFPHVAFDQLFTLNIAPAKAA